MQISMNKEELKKNYKGSGKGSRRKKRMENFLKSIPPISKQEIEDINKLYGKPVKKKEPAYGEEMEV